MPATPVMAETCVFPAANAPMYVFCPLMEADGRRPFDENEKPVKSASRSAAVSASSSPICAAPSPDSRLKGFTSSPPSRVENAAIISMPSAFHQAIDSPPDPVTVEKDSPPSVVSITREPPPGDVMRAKF